MAGFHTDPKIRPIYIHQDCITLIVLFMGCFVSGGEQPSIHPDRNAQEANKKAPFSKVLPQPTAIVSAKLDEQTQEVLYGILQKDSVTELGLGMDEWGIAVNSEVQDPGSYWTLVHLAARWNAAACLSYLLRKFYQEQPLGYVNFVNSQTCEGYTALMLAVIWNSDRCFSVLVNYGGSDLSIRDSRYADALAHALSYKRTKFADLLSKLRAQKVAVLPVNTAALGQPASLDKLLLQASNKAEGGEGFVAREDTSVTLSPNFSSYDTQRFELMQQMQLWKAQQEQILKKNYEDMARLIEENRKIQERLYQERQRLEEEQRKLKEEALKQQLIVQQQQQQHQQQQQQQQQQAIKQQKQLEEEAMRLKADEQRRLEEQRKAQEQEEAKQREVFLKKQQEIQKQRQQEMARVIEEQRKAQEQRILEEQKAQQAQNDDQPQEQDDEMQRRIQEQRELLKKSLEQKKKKAVVQVDPTQNTVDPGKLITPKNMVCPPELKVIYDELIAKKVNFIDNSFPPKLTTLGTSKKVDASMKSSVWLRPAQIFNKGSYELFDGIHPDDIKQGTLGVCYYLAAIASLAERDWRIVPLFPFYSKELGFYVVRLLVHGKPTNIVVDDFIPCLRGTNEPLFTRPNGREIWVMILEKAWAKNFGTYLSAEGMAPSLMMEDITMAPSKLVTFQDPHEIFSDLKAYDEEDYIIVLTSVVDQSQAPQGIVPLHAYSLLSVYEEGDLRLLKIRNPWGNYEWEGDYGDNSANWTPELEKKLGVVDADDGVFFVTPEQFGMCFIQYSVNMVREKYLYSYVEFTSAPDENLYYTFSLQQKGLVNLRITQNFDRLLNDKSYKYSPVIFQFGKIEDDQTTTFLGQGNEESFSGEKSVHMHEDIYLDLEPGEYFVRLRVLWNNKKYKTAILAAYAGQSVTFVRCDEQTGLSHWKNMIANFLGQQEKMEILPGIMYAEGWMKGQYVLMPENTTDTKYEVIITFNPAEILNVRIGNKKGGPPQIRFELQPQGGYDVGFLDKIILAAPSEVGGVDFDGKII